MIFVIRPLMMLRSGQIRSVGYFSTTMKSSLSLFRYQRPIMASNGGGPSRLPSARLVAAVAELTSLGNIGRIVI